jgi:hypothetical protein
VRSRSGSIVLGITDIKAASGFASIGASTARGTLMTARRPAVRSMRAGAPVESRIELPAATLASRPSCISVAMPVAPVIKASNQPSSTIQPPQPTRAALPST